MKVDFQSLARAHLLDHFVAKPEAMGTGRIGDNRAERRVLGVQGAPDVILAQIAQVLRGGFYDEAHHGIFDIRFVLIDAPQHFVGWRIEVGIHFDGEKTPGGHFVEIVGQNGGSGGAARCQPKLACTSIKGAPLPA